MWERYQDFLDNYDEDPAAVRRIMTRAQGVGGEADLDASGRITLPAEMRRKLQLENRELRLQMYRGAVQILTQEAWLEMERDADNDPDALSKLEKAGLGKGIR